MGVDGQRRVEVDSFGNERQVLARQGSHSGQESATHHRSGSAGGGRADHGESPRRGGGARSAQRRSAGHGQPPGLRSQPVRRPHPVQGLERSAGQSRSSAAEPRHSGAAGARIDVQADHGAGGSGNRRHRRQLPRHCPGGANFYGRFFKCWGKHGTRRAARRHRAFLRHVLLQRRQPPGHRRHRALRRNGRLRPQDRNRSAARSRRHGALHADGRSAISARNGIPARPFRWPSARAPPR